MSRPPKRTADAIAFAAILAPITVLFFVEAFLSLDWRMVHDTPLLHFAAYQIEHFDRVPYRDVFVTSMPGTLALHMTIGRLFGWSDFGFQLANLIFLATLSIVTWGILARLHPRAGWAAVALYGVAYFAGGPWTMLQRDIVGMLPVAAAVFIAGASKPGLGPRSLAIGLLFGAAVIIKPHLLIGLPVVLIFAWRCWLGGGVGPPPGLAIGISLITTAIGGALPAVVVLWWVATSGGLGDFLDMMGSYLPLHVHLTGTHETIGGAARVSHVLREWRTLGGHGAWLGPAAFGVYLGLDPMRSARERDTAGTLGGLAVAYGIYPAVSGQFWDYHWMPFQFWLVACAGLVAIPPSDPATTTPRRLVQPALLAAFVAVMLVLPPGLKSQLEGYPPEPPKEGRVDTIAAFLVDNVEPGDRVQSLDWTGGALHGMLIARVETATRYIYDYHFYHHVSHPVIQEHRERFLVALTDDPPRFLVRFDRPRVSGEDTADRFPALDAFVADGYVVGYAGDGFQILEWAAERPAHAVEIAPAGRAGRGPTPQSAPEGSGAGP